MDETLAPSEAAQWLEQAGFADWNSTNCKGWSPIHVASAEGNISALTYLIDSGASIVSTTQCKDALTPFLITALHNQFETAKWLYETNIAKKLTMEPLHIATNRAGSTALMMAAEKASLEFLKWLVDIGADIHAVNHRGSDVILWGISNPDLQVLVWLHQTLGLVLEKSNSDGMTCLSFAVLENNLRVVEYLLDHGASIHHPNSAQQTPFLLAAHSGNLEVAQYLLKRGANIMDRSSDGSNALHLAAQNGRLDMAKWLVDMRKDFMSEVSNNECDALMYACEGGHRHMVEWLIDIGFSPHKTSRTKTTTLSFALASGHFELFKWLYEKHEVDVKSTNSHGYDAMHAAVESGSVEAVRYLVEKCNFSFRPGTKRLGWPYAALAAERGHIPLVEYAIEEQKIAPNTIFYRQSTFFTLACVNDKVELTDWLYKRFPLPQLLPPSASQTDDGRLDTSCAMYAAAFIGNIKTLKLLRRYGMNLNFAEEETQWSPLMAAVAMGKYETVRWLVAHGADITFKNRRGEIALNMVSEGQIYDFFAALGESKI